MSAGITSDLYLSLSRAGITCLLQVPERLVAASADADARAVLELLRLDAGRLVALRADEHHVGEVDRPFLRDDLRLGVLLGGARVALHHVELGDEDLALLGDDADDLAALPGFLAGDDLDLVLLAHLHQSTSGASETIFM